MVVKSFTFCYLENWLWNFNFLLTCDEAAKLCLKARCLTNFVTSFGWKGSKGDAFDPHDFITGHVIEVKYIEEFLLPLEHNFTNPLRTYLTLMLMTFKAKYPSKWICRRQMIRHQVKVSKTIRLVGSKFGM